MAIENTYVKTLHLPCMPVTNILSIDNSDKDITIVDNVCILTFTYCGNHDCHCHPPEHAMSACTSPSVTVVVPSTTCRPCRGARPQRSLSRDRVKRVKEFLPHHKSLIIDEKSVLFPYPSRRAALVAVENPILSSYQYK